MTARDRLQVYRRAAGMTIAQLAEVSGISVRKLTGFEKIGKIDEQSLATLAQTFHYDPDLLGLDTPVPDVSAVSDQFDGMNDDEIDQIGAQAQLGLERHLLVDAQLPADDQRFFALPDGFPRTIETPRDAATAAEAVRNHWKLSAVLPICSLSDMLEGMGIRVVFIPGVPRLSAMAMLSESEPSLPVIVVRRDLPGDAQRFTMARELAFFLIENCNVKLGSHFAGALLLPAEALSYDLGSGRTDFELYELLMLKQKYGVSIRNVLTRAAALRLIPTETQKKWLGLFEAQGWNQTEPGAAYPPEESQTLIRRVMRLQSEGRLGVEQAAHLLDITLDEWINRLTLNGVLQYAVA